MKLFKKKNKVEETTPKVKKKQKYKTNLTSAFAGFISCAIVCALIACIVGVVIMFNMLQGKPDLDINDFTNDNSSTIYDRNGEVIAELGYAIRENVSFDDLPHSVVDAFVAVEDSRFFIHNGFDLPRFTKAILENIKSLSFSQGGSTFTMQLCKNTYFVNDNAGTNAAKTINRKVQEIALAFELESKMSKQEILVNYLNKLNYGGSRNIRGIEKASLYYFGKSVKDLDLSESAYIAGVVNAPGAFNAYLHPEAAQDRRDVVLYQMYNHGYITETEYKLATQIDLQSQLAIDSTSYKSGSGSKYQAYIDVVVEEIYELTGLDPYTTTMNVYTAMDKNVQETIDNIQKGEVDGYFDFPNDRFELASIAIDNNNGEIVGILGGRNYSSGGALLLNHATDQYKQPGSSIKPIMDYVLAFEHLGWSTDHVLVDKPINYVGTEIVVGNSDGVYRGEVNLQTCIVSSLNTTALQTIQQVVNKIGSQRVVEYLTKIGFTQASDPDSEFNVQWGIGGGEFYVSCEQMAAAFGTIINGGDYYTPHTIRKITFESNKDDVQEVYAPVNVLSPQSCYLMNTLLIANTQNGPYLRTLADSRYYVCSKTGTTDWGTSGRAYDIEDGAIKDGWCVAGTSDYSVATWIGYEKAVKGEINYFTLADWNKQIKEKVTNLIIDATVDSFGVPKSELKRPDGISTITHIVGTYPYASPIDGMPEEYISTGEIITKYANLVAPESASVMNISQDSTNNIPKVETDESKNLITLTWPKYPDEEALKVASSEMDLTLVDPEGKTLKEATGTRKFDYSWVYGAIKYKAAIEVFDAENNSKFTKTINSSENTFSTNEIELYPGGKVIVGFYYGYEKGTNSNIITIEKEVEDATITIDTPTAADLASLDTIKAWARKYGINEENIKASSKSEYSGTGYPKAVITYTKDDATTTLGTPTDQIKRSQLPSVQIDYQYYDEHKISLTLDKTGDISVGEDVTVTASLINVSEVLWSTNVSTDVLEVINQTPSGTPTYTFKIKVADTPVIITCKDKAGKATEQTIEITAK